MLERYSYVVKSGNAVPSTIFEPLSECYNAAERIRKSLAQSVDLVPPICTGTNGDGNQHTIPQPEIGTNPATVRIVPDSVREIKSAVKEAMAEYHIPLHKSEAEKWDKMSNNLFDGTGWAELAKMSLKELGSKEPEKKRIRQESSRIRALVTEYRSKQSPPQT